MLQKLKILKKLHNELTSEMDLTSILTLIVQETIKLLRADRCTLYVYDPITHELWSKVVSKLEVNEIRLKIGLGICGYVAQTREMVNVADAYSDPRFNKKIDEITNYRTQSILAIPMLNPDNQLIGVMEVINKKGEGSVFDTSDEFLISIISSISAVAIQQAQLYESNYSLRKYNETILENLDTGIVVIDAELRIILVNPAFEKIFQVNENEVEGQNIIEAIPVFDFFKHQFEKLKKKENTGVTEKELEIQGQTKYFNLNFNTMDTSEENPIGHIIIISDVTQDVQDKIKKKKEENLSLIGKMLTTVLHDVKNPLSAIKGFAELIGIRVENSEIKEFAAIIGKEIEKLNSMTKEILDFAKGETRLNIVNFKASEFIDELKIYFDHEFSKRKMKYDIEMESDFEMVLDPAKLLRAVLNIAKNAAEAMEPDKGIFKILIKKHNENVVIKLSDNGPGIPKNMLKKIFQPFFTRGKTLGTGLGLAIVKKMISDHNGIIKIWSEENKGTVFTLEIPLNFSAGTTHH